MGNTQFLQQEDAQDVKPLEKVKWMAMVAKDSALSDSAVRVAVYLCDCENDKTGQCNPAIEWIARDTNLSKRAVQYAISALETAGYIGVDKKGNGKGNRTEYTFSKGANSAPLKGANSAPLQKPKGAKNDTKGCKKRHAKGAKNDIPPFTPLYGEPVKRTSERTSEGSDGGEKNHPLTPQLFDAPPAAEANPNAATWDAYSAAYAVRYGVSPVRNATVNSQMAAFVKRIGVTESPAVAEHYVASNNGFYVKTGHQVANLLKDAEKLRTEWATGRRVTQSQASQVDRTQTNFDAAQEAKRILANRRGIGG